MKTSPASAAALNAASSDASIRASANPHQVATEHELAVLYWLHRFGWLRTCDLAHLVWPNAHQAEQMARRIVRRLADRQQLYSVRLPDGVPAHALTHAGAVHLQPYQSDARANHALKRSLGHYAHRILCNEWSIANLTGAPAHKETSPQPRFPVYTEFDIQSRPHSVLVPSYQLPGDGSSRKIADCLIDVTQQGEAYSSVNWVEVERAWKRASDYAKLLDFIKLTLGRGELLLRTGSVDVKLFRIQIVATTENHFERLADALARDTRSAHPMRLSGERLYDIRYDIECVFRHPDGTFERTSLADWLNWDEVADD